MEYGPGRGLEERERPEEEIRRILAVARAAVERIALLQALTAGLAPLGDRQAVADFVLGSGVASLGGRTGSICLLTPAGDELAIVAQTGYPNDVLDAYATFPLAAALPASDAARSGKPVYLESPEERDALYPDLGSAPLVQDAAYAIVPLAVGKGAAVGALVVGFPTPTQFNEDDRSFLEALASQCAIALERARLYAEAERGQRRMAFLADMSGFLAGLLDPEAALNTVAALAVPRLADWCAIHVLERGRTVAQVAPTPTDPARHAALVADVGTRTAGVIASGRAEVHQELPGGGLVAQPTFGAAMVLPLRARGRVLGTLSLVNEQGRLLTDDDTVLARELAARAAVALDTARLFNERSQVARRLQDSLLPPTLPSIPGLELGARYRAAGEGLDVGGDFYDAFPVGPVPGRWMLAVGDVRGHGVEAAAVTGLARHTIRSAAIAGWTPSQILRHLNDVLLRHEEERGAGAPDDWETTEPRFLTVLLVAVELTADGAQSVICAAGHPLPLLRRAHGTVTPAGRPGGLVGIVPDIDLVDTPVFMGPGDALVCFTDGVVERHEDGRFVGESGIAEAIARAEQADAASLARLVEATAVAFGKDQPEDDMAVLVVRVAV
ncbi:MAG: SpoIIE family protein phosphatase [Actinobacteria bacterium]|nr:SpoIIE family protein phosphatase [Actinomycetota bacterium]